MRRNFRYKAIPTKETEEKSIEWLDMLRVIYNCALEQRILNYLDGRNTSYYDQANELPELKKTFQEYLKINSQVIRECLRRLSKAYDNFFRRAKTKSGKVGFPRFKGKYRYDSFTYPSKKDAAPKWNGNHLTLSKLGTFKVRLHRPIEGTIKTVTVKRTKTGEWFIIFSCDNVPVKPIAKTEKTVGIDLGLNFFAVDSDGKKWDNPRHLRRKERYLKRCQRALARKKKGSKNREKSRIKLAKAYAKVTNQRQDFAHKFANYYVENYDHIAFENLNIRGMVRNKHLAKSISDAAWSMAIQFTTYKAEGAGKLVTKEIAKDTSILCNECGQRVPKKLYDRLHVCPTCGLVQCRDLNAAKNIKARAMPFEHNAPVVMGRAQVAAC